MKVALVDKKTKTIEVGDATYISGRLGVCRDTIKARLPYWENADWILGDCIYIKSKRGGKIGNLNLRNND